MKNLTNHPEDSKMSNLNDNTANTTTNHIEDNIMNLFSDIAIQEEEVKSPKDWTLNDCKKNLKAIFKDSSEPDTYIVSINLGGFTALKLNGNKTTFKMKKGMKTKEQIVDIIIDEDNVILEAQKRLIISLTKAQYSREMNRKRDEKEALKQTKCELERERLREEDGQEYSQPSYSE
jgi:hypothetical protein